MLVRIAPARAAAPGTMTRLIGAPVRGSTGWPNRWNAACRVVPKHIADAPPALAGAAWSTASCRAASAAAASSRAAATAVSSALAAWLAELAGQAARPRR